jgi:NADPH-dependent 2,4-dienoyl-CoA reductase/sulfur reductase-like enzyme
MTDVRSFDTDVLVIGGGPAGLAAAYSAARSGRRVLLVDENPTPGGQIWRGEWRAPRSSEAASWFDRIRRSRIPLITGVRIVTEVAERMLLGESQEAIYEFRYKVLILATGARERFLPFPGWTLPNVMGAGGLQALVKAGLPISGKRVVVAGTGPLLLAVAAYLQEQGAQVLLIAEQATRARMLSLGVTLLRFPSKAWQAVVLRGQLWRVPYASNCWPIAAYGEGSVQGVLLRQGSRTREIPCDYVACGFHLVPNIELPLLLGCELCDGYVRVNEFQETSRANVFCAGEPTGIGGVDLALIEGQIAGYAAVGHLEAARALFGRRARWRRFASRLDRAFALRPELRTLPDARTIVCRCEDVPFERLKGYSSWKEAKLQTRCGMGPCQGRICGPAAEFLFGWSVESPRPPIFPARVASLMRTPSSERGGNG